VGVGSAVEARSDAESTDSVPHIRYEYRVGGEKYVSTRISFGQLYLDSHDGSAELVAAYPPGRAVDVYYKPTDPARSALFVGVRPLMYAQPMPGLVILLIGAIMARGQRHPAERHV
jgi:hypothetical protein